MFVVNQNMMLNNINYIFQLAGISLITVGTIALVKLGDIEDAFKEGSPTAGPIATVVLGSIIFLISFFGCCGAIRESSCMVSVVRNRTTLFEITTLSVHLISVCSMSFHLVDRTNCVGCLRIHLH